MKEKNRIFTYFGVPVPPWKEEKIGNKGTTIFFILTGKTPSKKNNQHAVTIRKYARSWAIQQSKTGRSPSWADVHKAISMCKSKMRGNTEYLAFLEKVKPVLQKQAACWSEKLFYKGLVFPIKKSTLALKFYFKDRYVTDTVNKQQTIQDVLVHSGIIANDDYNSLNPINSASGLYYEEIVKDISRITLTFNL